MIREFKQTLAQEMVKIMEKLNNGYTIDFTQIVDRIYYINSIVFNGMESPIIAPVEESCTPLPPPIITDPVDPTPVKTIPTVSTGTTVATSNTTISSGGNILSEGNTPVLTKGVCWVENTNPTLVPTIADNYTTNGSGTGSFTSLITGLEAGTSYHIRAYANNMIGYGYGEKITLTTSTTSALPTVSTNPATVTSTTISTGGNVLSQGSSAVTARGVCINTSPDPTIANLKTSNGTGTGTYSSDLTGLAIGTTYYIRAYATNSTGTAYGNTVVATTSAINATVVTADVTSITAISAVIQ